MTYNELRKLHQLLEEENYTDTDTVNVYYIHPDEEQDFGSEEEFQRDMEEEALAEFISEIGGIL